ncbi:MAG: GNAT family N-acetyltransferase [Chloroflexota bacterium]|nr:GNAT family N-acetyltransferase [Chloroflexota bacterium]
MKAQLRKYRPERDFLRVRDFLVETYLASEEPHNWGLERWNWARYHPVIFEGNSEENIRFWEDSAGVWENDAKEIVGVVHVETPMPGEAFFQRHPQHAFLLDEMLDYAEVKLVDKEHNTLRIHVYDHDGVFQALVQQRGYQKNTRYPGYDSEFVITGVPEQKLPEGYAVRSMAEGGDIEKRCKVQGLGFNHLDPAEWTTVSAYKEVQKAPDYRDDLDLYVVGPDGEYVSCCIVWYDEHNRMGFFEPVCTHLDFRRRGFGRAVVMEGIRRVAALGAERARVGSGQPFYEAVGFQKKYTGHSWTRQF